MVLVAGCDDEKRVDGVRPAPMEVGVAFGDAGPDPSSDATGTADAGSGQSDAVSSGDDAGPRCEESPVVEAAPPVGRCPAVVPAFAEVPCDTTLTLPGLSAPGEIVFTEQGVPHVYARTVADAARLQGYIVARDRFFELELTRRNTLGELSGWFSALTLATDIENRTYGQAQAARRILNQGSSPEMRTYFAAYAEGINLWRARLLAGLEVRPPEFLVVGDVVTLQDDATIVPEWTAQDVAAGAAAITYALAFDGEDLGRSEALGRAAEFGAGLPAESLRRDAALRDIIGALAPLTETTQTGAEVPKRGRGPSGALGLGLPAGLRASVARAVSRSRALAEAPRGSNTWAVDAAHGADGVAWLASDPHLELGAPTFFYQIHLDTAELAPNAPASERVRTAGVTLPGTPFVVIGHTDRIAWGITNLNADDNDFYLEEVTLAAGRPAFTRAPSGDPAVLVELPEVYTLAPAIVLGRPEAETCVIPRWETADGRMLVGLEGNPVEDEDALDCNAPGDAVNIAGTWLVPGDVDGDGRVTGVSLDFTGLDANPLAETVLGYLRAQNIDDFLQAQRHSVTFNNAQAVADVTGRIATTGFHAVPLRTYLRNDAGGFDPDASPLTLIDGTRYPSFRVELDETLRIVDDAADPLAQVIPFADWPRSVDPDRGFVVSANNELTGGTFDNDIGNEPFYLGYNFDIGFRAERITALLKGFVDAGTPIGRAEMARIQNDHRSNYGARIADDLLAGLGATCADPRAAEVRTRLERWAERGFEAASGVVTFYHPVLGPNEVEDAVATTLFNLWVTFTLRGVLDDEALGGVHWNGGGSDARARLLARMLESADTLAGFDAAAGDHVYWDDTTTPTVESRAQILCAALTRALDHLASDAPGGFGTADLNAWRWGLRHVVNFEHTFIKTGLGADPLLAGFVDPLSIVPRNLPVTRCLGGDDDPRSRLLGYPRPGDNFTVDACDAGWNPETSAYDSGPVQRLIVKLSPDGIESEVVLPGGQVGRPDHPNWADQARTWLANERKPIRFRTEDVAAHALSRITFMPPSR